jgi:hypothetical protein
MLSALAVIPTECRAMLSFRVSLLTEVADIQSDMTTIPADVAIFLAYGSAISANVAVEMPDHKDIWKSQLRSPGLLPVVVVIRKKKPMYRLPRATTLTLALLVVAGCTRHEKGKLVDQAVQQTGKYYTYIQKDSIDAALGLFDAKFFAITGKGKFRDMLMDIRQRLGTIKKVELLKTAQTTERVLGIESGNVIVSYKVIFNSGNVASQEFEFDASDRVFELIDRWTFKEYHGAAPAP